MSIPPKNKLVGSDKSFSCFFIIKRDVYCRIHNCISTFKEMYIYILYLTFRPPCVYSFNFVWFGWETPTGILLTFVVTLLRVFKGSEVHFLVKGVFSPGMSPNIMPVDSWNLSIDCGFTPYLGLYHILWLLVANMQSVRACFVCHSLPGFKLRSPRAWTNELDCSGMGPRLEWMLMVYTNNKRMNLFRIKKLITLKFKILFLFFSATGCSTHQFECTNKVR